MKIVREMTLDPTHSLTCHDLPLPARRRRSQGNFPVAGFFLPIYSFVWNL